MSGNDREPETAQAVLKSANFSRAGPSNVADLSDAQSILASQNLATLHPLGRLSDKELDFLQLEDDRLNQLEGAKGILPSRGWGDELCYGTGSTYLTGLAAGGVWGLREGIFKPIYKSNTASAILNAQRSAVGSAAAPAAELGSQVGTGRLRTYTPFRLRLNTVLNAMTARGSFVGNNAGVLALIYNGINSSIDKYRGRHDIYGSMIAGAGTGAIWRSTAGIRPMIIASGVMTAGAAAWTLTKPYLL